MHPPADSEPTRKRRACIPCHERKLRCDADHAGLPCTRCVQSKTTTRCELVPIPSRAVSLSKKRKREEQLGRQGANRSAGDTTHITPTANAELDDIRVSSTIAPTRHGGNLQTAGECTPRHIGAGPSPSSSSSTKRTASVASRIPNEQTQYDLCRAISQNGTGVCEIALSPNGVCNINGGGQEQEVLEYYDRVSSVSILSETLMKPAQQKLVRLVLTADSANCATTSIPNQHSDYLREQGAFTLPAQTTRVALVRIFLEHAYPYCPVLDRHELLRDFIKGNYSPFLTQALIAHLVPFISEELILELGFIDRTVAQRTIFNRAQLLYDLGAEKSQLRILQGCLLLGSLQLSLSIDKDYRYWHANAVRLATQIGLHRQQMALQVDQSTRKLLRRLWWVLYNRDVLLCISGVSNIRYLNDKHCDTELIKTSDLQDSAHEVEENQDTAFSRPLLPAVTSTHTEYFVQNTRLAKICAAFVDAFTEVGGAPTLAVQDALVTSLQQWKRELPAEMRLDAVDEWSCKNVWVLVLRVTSCRFESILYRTLKEVHRVSGMHGAMARSEQKQQDSMLQLSSALERITLYDLVQHCPLSVRTAAATVVAMHIETALDPRFSGSRRMTARGHIHNDMAYIRSSAGFSEGSRRALQTLEAIIARTELKLDETGDTPQVKVGNANSLGSAAPEWRARAGPRHNAVSAGDSIRLSTSPVPQLPSGQASESVRDIFDYTVVDLNATDVQIDLRGGDHEDWLNDLVGFNLMSENAQELAGCLD